nr:tetraspanin-10 [Ipomoea batatas]
MDKPNPSSPLPEVPAPKKQKMSTTTTSDDEDFDPAVAVAAVNDGSASPERKRKYKRRKIAIFFAYYGVGYPGMQKNPGAKTIEGDLEEALFHAEAVPEYWILAVGVIGFGVWMGANHDGCRKSLALHIIILGALIFVVSVFGFLGAWKSNSILLWIYLIMLFFILVAILIFTVLAFIVTNNGSGHSVNGLRYKEYQLQDYHSWFLKQVCTNQSIKFLNFLEGRPRDLLPLSLRFGQTFQGYAVVITFEEDFIFR